MHQWPERLKTKNITSCYIHHVAINKNAFVIAYLEMDTLGPLCHLMELGTMKNSIRILSSFLLNHHFKNLAS